MHLRAIVLPILLAASPAAADAIGPFGGECPPGAVPMMSGHGSWTCSPRACQSDGTCVDVPGFGGFGTEPPGPSECREVALCMTTRVASQGMPGPVDRGPPQRMVHAVSECGEGDACDEGQCERAMRCVETERREAEEAERAAQGGDDPATDEAEGAEVVADEAPADAVPEEPDGGCGCAAPGRGAASMGWALLVFGVVVARRR